MTGLLDRLLGREQKSAQTAKERLKLVLVHDRTDISPGIIDLLKDDLIITISKHIEIDPAGVRIQMKQDGNEQRLIADIPLRSSRKRRLG
jgi:cell division topological specificity factor